MYCTNCGARVGNVNFCGRCGTPVSSDERERWERGQRETERREDEPRAESRTRDSSARSSGTARHKVEEYVRDPRRTQELLSAALRKASSPRDRQKVVDDVWELLQRAARLIQASVSGEYKGFSGKRLALVIGAILYYVSPIDIIPDFIPIAGLFDDLGILAFALRSIKDELDAFEEWERRQGRDTTR